MSQALATLSRFQPVDYAGAVAAGQQARENDLALENVPAQNALERMKIGDAMGQQTALGKYRAEAGKTDSVSALGELESYPELQTKIMDALGGMPVREQVKAKKRTEAFGRAARWMMSYPEGSPQRKQAFQTSLNTLRKGGYIEQDAYELGMQTEPTDLFLNEYIAADDFMKQFDPVKKAQVANINSRTENADALTNARIDRIETLNEQGDARVGIAKDKSGNKVVTGGGGKREEAALKRIDSIAKEQGIDYGTPEYANLKAQVFSEMGLGGNAPAPAQPGNVSGSGSGKSEADPAAPQSQEEFNALPPGSYFINPADGKLMKKK